jgi:hypothetical protein
MMTLTAVVAALLLLFVAVGCWMYANNRAYPPERKSGYMVGLLFILLAVLTLLTRAGLLVAVRASFITAVVLFGIGLLGKRWSEQRRKSRLGQKADAYSDYFGIEETGVLAALEYLLAGDIKLVGVTLALIGGVLWTIQYLRS